MSSNILKNRSQLNVPATRATGGGAAPAATALQRSTRRRKLTPNAPLPREDAMSKIGAVIAAVWCLVFATGPAAAAVDCSPYCDFTHYYGPQDFTYVRPGLYVYPRCGPSGNCSPYLVSSSRRYYGRVRVRSVPRPMRLGE
jgi:hypothetical protein